LAIGSLLIGSIWPDSSGRSLVARARSSAALGAPQKAPSTLWSETKPPSEFAGRPDQFGTVLAIDFGDESPVSESQPGCRASSFATAARLPALHLRI
jgi:hypothetical protein